MSSWIKFFTTAGIPAGPATTYATIFVDNRMQINMLMDLNKEYLKDMGVTVMGDIIAILKYAKTAHAEYERDKPALNTSSMKPTEKVELKRHMSAGSRMLEHYMRREGIETETPPKVAVSPAMAVRLGAVPKTGTKSSTRQPAAEIIPVKRARKVDPSEEGHYVISMPKGQSNVFQRLGKEVGSQSATPKSSGGAGDVFSRLGGVQAQRMRSLSETSVTSILEYKGVLKEGSPKRPTQEKTLTVKIPSIFKEGLTGLQRPEITTTSNMSKQRPLTTKGVKGRLGGKPKMVSLQKSVPVLSKGQKSPVKVAGGVNKGPKVTVTLSGMRGEQTSRFQGRLGGKTTAGRFSQSMFGKGKVIKTTKQQQQPVVVTLVSDKPKQKVTMKERLGSFKAEASSTTPSFNITTKNATKRLNATNQQQRGLGGQGSGKRSVFNRLGRT
ncbi:hypothetical protein BSL78_27761 [Apostichopus japonicus]|uniref:DUF5577 domain-containing protein n=1 Tax=Stichopus japonicus TaxID=307972 RepID=A0A2G8JI64_STIJA|nr:hypothetical protein BSL78_27761 [Apostichopus japonicus]